MKRPSDTYTEQTCFMLMFRSAESERLARLVDPPAGVGPAEAQESLWCTLQTPKGRALAAALVSPAGQSPEQAG